MWLVAVLGIIFGAATLYEFVVELYWSIVARTHKTTGHLFKKHFWRGVATDIVLIAISLWVIIDCSRYLLS